MPAPVYVALKAHIGFKMLRLLYRWSTDGAGKAKFHQQCDEQGPTIFVAELSEGGFVGGFASVSWDSVSYGASDASAFLFTVKSGSSTVKFLKQTGQDCRHALTRHQAHGIVFGAGHDLQISLEIPLALYCGTSHTYAPHGIASGTRLKDVVVFGFQT